MCKRRANYFSAIFSIFILRIPFLWSRKLQIWTMVQIHY